MKRIITQEQIDKIVKYSQLRYSNRQIAIECGMKYDTLGYWKRKLRNEGVSILALLGRPIKKHFIGTIAEMEKQIAEDKEMLTK